VFCTLGAIYVNEIAATGIPNFCGGVDYIELFNSGPNILDLGGYYLTVSGNSLSGSSRIFTIPSFTILAAGAFKTYCRGFPGSFNFSLSAERLTFLDKAGTLIFISDLHAYGSSTSSTFQRLPNDMYLYGPPSPNAANAVPAAVINEVAPAGTSDTSICGGGPFIELTNIGAGTVFLSGFKLYNFAGPDVPTAFTFGRDDLVIYGTYTIFCYGSTSNLVIDSSDIVTLRNANGQDVSTTGLIGGLSPRPKAVDLVWARAVDLINLGNPDPVSYQYSKDPTPGKPNIFPFDPIQPPLQNCGIQTAPLPCLADYEFKETLLFDGYPSGPKFSGGTVDGSTCNHLIVNDERNILDVSIIGGAVQLKRTIPFIGGSRDNEGMCYYSPGKIAVVDERERSGTCPKLAAVFECKTSAHSLCFLSRSRLQLRFATFPHQT
jgi:hypothetical protein